MSINEITEKIKISIANLEKREIYTVIIIILASSASFGLGRLSSLDYIHEPLSVIEGAELGGNKTVKVNPEIISTASAIETAKSGQRTELYVASKNGTKYFFPWCGGAKSISETNKIWFESKESALAAGYLPAANCKGL